MVNYEKGASVNIKKGSYAGLQAWYNTLKEPTKHKVSIVIETKEKKKIVTKVRLLNKTSVEPLEAAVVPANDLDMVIFRNKKVMKNLHAAAAEIAKLGVLDHKGTGKLFAKLVKNEIAALIEQGDDAVYYGSAFLAERGTSAKSDVKKRIREIEDVYKMDESR